MDIENSKMKAAEGRLFDDLILSSSFIVFFQVQKTES